jgi:hypothetical protein
MSQLTTEVLIKPNRMRWVGHIAHMVKRNSYNFFIGKSQGKNALEVWT